jgi:hypothetical protein
MSFTNVRTLYNSTPTTCLKNNLRNPLLPTDSSVKNVGRRGRKGKILQLNAFYVILRNSELVTIYCKYHEILDSHSSIVEGPSRPRCDAVFSSNAFPRK